jgi:hypothetical protein
VRVFPLLPALQVMNHGWYWSIMPA